MLLEINFTIVLFAVSFLIFVSLLNLTLIKPVAKVIEKRKGIIEEDLLTSKNSTDSAIKILSNYEKNIKATRIESMKLLESEIQSAQSTKQVKLNELLSVLNSEKTEALKNIDLEAESAKNDLLGKIQLLSELITSKILGSSIKEPVSR